MLVELRLECLLGDVTSREGALPTVGLQVRTLILHATSTPVPDPHILQCGGQPRGTPGDCSGSGSRVCEVQRVGADGAQLSLP